MNLRTKKNEELLQELKDLAQNERQLLLEVLYRLREVEDRKLHLEMGYPDIYRFAQGELGYSSGAAYRRVSAMRLLKTLPEMSEKLESGALGLENASRAQSLFRKEDQKRRDAGQAKMATAAKKQIVENLIGKSTRDAERVLMSQFPEQAAEQPLKPVFKPTWDGKTVIQFVASPELMAKLEELKGLMAHSNFEGRMDVLIEKLADQMLKKLKPTPRKTPAPGNFDSRNIPASERRKVLERDQAGCTYRDPKSGRVCGSKHGLQFDHIHPFSLGGKSVAENFRLTCGAHNRYAAERVGLGRPGYLTT